MKLKSRRTFWIVGILTVVFIAVGIVVFRPSDRRFEAQIKKLGGEVNRKPLFPEWVYASLPHQVHPYLPNGAVESLGFSKHEITDADIQPILGYFPDIVELRFFGTGITDDLLKPISKLSKLRVITLRSTAVTDEGVKILSKNPRIKHLNLYGTKITDGSRSHLGQMKQLEWLSIGDTSVTDDSVETLCQLPNLVFLNIQLTKISKDGIQRLSKIKGLTLISDLGPDPFPSTPPLKQNQINQDQ